MQVFKLMCLKTAIILTFIAGLIIATGQNNYLWLLLILIPSFFADLIKIVFIGEKGRAFAKELKESANEQRKSD